MEVAIRLDTDRPAAGGAGVKSPPRWEHALELLLQHRGNPLMEIERVLADDPLSVSAHCLRAAVIVCTDAVAARASLAESIAAIEAASPEEPSAARRHAAAARAWFNGDSALAVERYGAILIDWPRDILALVVAHALDFRLSDKRMLRDRVARILPRWEATTPRYASVLAMYAFGLEENGQYRQAEKTARRALALDPGHPGAVHVIVHVMEMQGRAREGLAFLAATESAWVDAAGIAVHLAWHCTLFHLALGEPESALSVYDAQIANTRVPGMSALADASALLWRLRLRNIHVGGRWQQLADSWEMQNLTGARPFYVVHAMMAFAAAGRTAAAARVCEGLTHVDTSAASSSYPEDALTPPLCKALLAFARSDYAACVGWLLRVRHIAHLCGGSLAQCDVIHLTLTEAAMRARERESDRAHAPVSDRTARMPASQRKAAGQLVTIVECRDSHETVAAPGELFNSLAPSYMPLTASPERVAAAVRR